MVRHGARTDRRDTMTRRLSLRRHAVEPATEAERPAPDRETGAPTRPPEPPGVHTEMSGAHAETSGLQASSLPLPETTAVHAAPLPLPGTTATAATGAPTPAGLQPEPPGAPPVPSFRDRGRLRRRLRFLRGVRELGFRDLGGLVFDLHRFGRDAPLLVEGKLEALATVDTELRALEEVLRDRPDVVILREPGIAACPRCAALHGSDARFCSSCGLHLDGPQSVSEVGDAPVAGLHAPAQPVASPPEPSPPAPGPDAQSGPDAEPRPNAEPGPNAEPEPNAELGNAEPPPTLGAAHPEADAETQPLTTQPAVTPGRVPPA